MRLGIRDRRRLPSDDLPRGCGAGSRNGSPRNRPHSLVRCGGRIGCRCLCHRQKHQISTARSKGPTGAHRNISESSGSCRDMATLMLEALRVLGLPARFASGCLDCALLKPKQTAERNCIHSRQARCRENHSRAHGYLEKLILRHRSSDSDGCKQPGIFFAEGGAARKLSWPVNIWVYFTGNRRPQAVVRQVIQHRHHVDKSEL